MSFHSQVSNMYTKVFFFFLCIIVTLVFIDVLPVPPYVIPRKGVFKGLINVDDVDNNNY